VSQQGQVQAEGDVRGRGAVVGLPVSRRRPRLGETAGRRVQCPEDAGVFMPAGTSLTLPGIITVFCLIGEQAPPTHDNPTEPGEEGVTAVIPGVANFNKIVSGMNRFVQTS